jgi:hypothetical protein
MTFVLGPRGRGRNRLRAGFTAGLLLVVLAELLLAADYLAAMVYAAILAPCVADVAFRWQVPEEGFPITYQTRGSAATWTSAASAAGRSSGPWPTSSACR